MHEPIMKNPVHAFRLDELGNIYLEFHSGDQIFYIEYTDLAQYVDLMDMTQTAFKAQTVCHEEGMDAAYAAMGIDSTVDADEITMDKFL